MNQVAVVADVVHRSAPRVTDVAARDPILFLSHRLPYPPNKGDKVRSFHLLEQLASRYRVFLGTFVDDAADLQHTGKLRPLCAGMNVRTIAPMRARTGSLVAFASGMPLSVAYYRDAVLAQWVREIVRSEGIRSAVVFSSPMFQFVDGLQDLNVVTDFVDVDSMKWTQYAARTRAPLSWLYGREGTRLLAYERAAAARSTAAFFVTDAETALFRRLAPECSQRARTLENGVDAGYFDPQASLPSPYPAGELPIVFTGAMDYRPNVDAVCWFAEQILPEIGERFPAAKFYVVGVRPAPAVRALRASGVIVTGGVPDVRPFLRHAALAVAPLRIARGVQNKVLEAMAMARAIVVSAEAANGIDATAGFEFEVAGTPREFAAKAVALLRDPTRAAVLGRAARSRVLKRYAWAANLAPVIDYLREPVGDAPARDFMRADLPGSAPSP